LSQVIIESKEIYQDFQEAIKNPKKFEEYIKDNPEELQDLIDIERASNNFDEFESTMEQDLQGNL
jgi:hypothetical protein